jgi:hypothetical protein
VIKNIGRNDAAKSCPHRRQRFFFNGHRLCPPFLFRNM